MTYLRLELKDGTKLSGNYSDHEALERVFMALASGELREWSKREIR